MEEDGKLYEDPVKIANILQKQYKSVFSDPDTDINIDTASDTGTKVDTDIHIKRQNTERLLLGGTQCSRPALVKH